MNDKTKTCVLRKGKNVHRTTLHYGYMAGEQRPGGTRQLGHWLGDRLSNHSTPPITDMNT